MGWPLSAKNHLIVFDVIKTKILVVFENTYHMTFSSAYKVRHSKSLPWNFVFQMVEVWTIKSPVSALHRNCASAKRFYNATGCDV